MQRGILILVCAMLWCGISNSQTKSAPKPSLKETLVWMDHFSTEDGFVAVNGQFTRTNKLSGEECVVSIEFHYLKATGTSPKTAITELNLADFDPRVKL